MMLNDEDVEDVSQEPEEEQPTEPTEKLGVMGAPKGSVLDMVHELYNRGLRKRRDIELLKLIEEELASE